MSSVYLFYEKPGLPYSVILQENNVFKIPWDAPETHGWFPCLPTSRRNLLLFSCSSLIITFFNAIAWIIPSPNCSLLSVFVSTQRDLLVSTHCIYFWFNIVPRGKQVLCWTQKAVILGFWPVTSCLQIPVSTFDCSDIEKHFNYL